MSAESKIDASRLKPETLAKLLSAASKQDVFVENVEKIVDEGNLLDADGTVDFLEYLAYLLTSVK